MVSIILSRQWVVSKVLLSSHVSDELDFIMTPAAAPSSRLHNDNDAHGLILGIGCGVTCFFLTLLALACCRKSGRARGKGTSEDVPEAGGSTSSGASGTSEDVPEAGGLEDHETSEEVD